MKKKKLNKYMIDTFEFNIKEEKLIYKYLCKEDLTKRQKRKLTEDIKFERFKDWEDYIINKYKKYDAKSLNEFKKMLNILFHNSNEFTAYNKNVCTAYISSAMTILLRDCIDGLQENMGIISNILLMLFFPSILVYLLFKSFKEYKSDYLIMLYKDIINILDELIN